MGVTATVSLRVVINPPPSMVTFSPIELSVAGEASIEITLSAVDAQHPDSNFVPQWDAIDHFRIVDGPDHGTITGIDANSQVAATNTGAAGSQKTGTATITYSPDQ